ncbi:hypothetical protein GCM10008090_29520 [Arenicella chitinivorans]|uniref:Uncharacterized protein n=1 Tax=Arenicella chitinivorans TaxID=1329800 RepID=A0A918S0H6_9GAMM|nr:hypothetical protein [Arenicella chitinivorans]GHA17896.1 hypothetical protein GCM10008090_29520 [Arenicella chitinivorans]
MKGSKFSRRDVLKPVVGTGLVLGFMPETWRTPLINAVITPAHAQTSCSGFSESTVNESITITVTANEVQGPIVVTRSGNRFDGSDASRIDECQGGNDLDVDIQFSGTIDVAANQISGDLIIVQSCGGQLVCEQVSQFIATQTPIDAGSELGDYQGAVTGTLRCCDDFA